MSNVRWPPLARPTKQTARNVVSKLRVQSFAISIDGYGAGPNQDLQNPLGVRGPELMEWFFHTRVWQNPSINSGPLTPSGFWRSWLDRKSTRLDSSHQIL